MKIFNRLADRFAKVKPLPAGMYHVQAPPDAERPYRLHLRLDPDGSGVLIVNAATVLHLNPTAAEYAFHFVQGTPPEEAARQIGARYRVSKGMALEDFQDFADRIQTLVTTPDLDPVSYLDFERVAPHSTDLSAPLRLDCALTYRLPPGTRAEYAPTRRVERELSTDEWLLILDKAWQVGIPHVTFTGGEPTLRDDLPALIGRAEQNGQVSGLLTDGLRLADKQYLDLLLQTGLDHILFILAPENPATWQALESLIPEDIFVTAHLTLNQSNAKDAGTTLQKLAGLGIGSLSLSASDPVLNDAFKDLQNQAANLGLTLRYDLPVPYSAEHPVAVETQGDQIPSGAGRVWLYVEPDGDVLPAQGMAGHILGNILRDEWARIYAQPQPVTG